MPESCLKLHVPNYPILSFLGIQPYFMKDNILERNVIFSISRLYNKKSNVYGNFMIQNKVRTASDMEYVKKRRIHYTNLEKYIVYNFYEKGMQFFSDKPWYVKAKEKTLKEEVLFLIHLMKYKNYITKGNGLISSNQALLDSLNFRFTEVQNLMRYKTSPEYLPENVLLVISRGMTNFDTPYIATPLIDRKFYNDFLKENDLPEEYELDYASNNNKFRHIKWYSNIIANQQAFLDKYMPDYWLVEKVMNKKYAQGYIMVLTFPP